MTLPPGGRVQASWRHNFNALACGLNGRGRAGHERGAFAGGQLVVSGNDDVIAMEADAVRDSRAGNVDVLLLPRRPISALLVFHGPFVRRIRDDIVEAIRDYRPGRMGQMPPTRLDLSRLHCDRESEVPIQLPRRCGEAARRVRFASMGRPLEGIRVVELGTFVSAPYCGKLFAGYGAEVIKVEPPGGDIARAHGPFPRGEPDPEASALFLYLNTGKKSVVLNPREPADRDRLLRLLETADVLIENYRPADLAALGLDYATLAARNPRLVMVSITPFGQYGPYANYLGNNLIAFAMGGQMYITGTFEGGPVKNGGYQADYQGGLNAFSAAMLAVLTAEREGRGQHVDVSIQRCMAPILEASIPYYCYLGQWSGIRRGNHMASFIGIYPCADGHIGIHLMPRNWKPFLEVIGRPDLGEDPRFATQADRVAHNDELMAELYAWAATETKHDLYRRAGAGRAPVAFVHTMADLIESPQLNARGFLQRIDHPVAGEGIYPGPPWWMGPDDWGAGRAPLYGEHTAEVLGRLQT